MSNSTSLSNEHSNWSPITPFKVEDELQESEESNLDANWVGHILMDEDTDLEAYFDEPLTDDGWLEEYHQRKEEDNAKMNELNARLLAHFAFRCILRFLLSTILVSRCNSRN